MLHSASCGQRVNRLSRDCTSKYGHDTIHLGHLKNVFHLKREPMVHTVLLPAQHGCCPGFGHMAHAWPRVLLKCVPSTSWPAWHTWFCSADWNRIPSLFGGRWTVVKPVWQYESYDISFGDIERVLGKRNWVYLQYPGSHSNRGKMFLQTTLSACMW